MTSSTDHCEHDDNDKDVDDVSSSSSSSSLVLQLEFELKELIEELQQTSVWERNNKLCLVLINEILPKWQRRYNHNTYCSSNRNSNRNIKNDLSSWKKIKKRIVKEFNECEPFITYVLNKIQQDVKDIEMSNKSNENHENNKNMYQYQIVDLCSGFGIQSMLLSELLNDYKEYITAEIWLLDKAFPLVTRKQNSDNNNNNKKTNSNTNSNHHISTNHITQYEDSWPIPLYIRKIDIKKSREIQQLFKYVFFDNDTNNANNTEDNANANANVNVNTNVNTNVNIILIGVHLCKSLSIHAIHLYEKLLSKHDAAAAAASATTTTTNITTTTTTTTTNTHTTTSSCCLLLKPCCIPGNPYNMNRNRNIQEYKYNFQNGYSFELLDVYYDDDDDDKKKKRSSKSHANTNSTRSNTITNTHEQEEDKEEEQGSQVKDDGNDDEGSDQYKSTQDSTTKTKTTTRGTVDQKYHNRKRIDKERYNRWVQHLYNACCYTCVNSSTGNTYTYVTTCCTTTPCHRQVRLENIRSSRSQSDTTTKSTTTNTSTNINSSCSCAVAATTVQQQQKQNDDDGDDSIQHEHTNNATHYFLDSYLFCEQKII